tara:strand:- start:276 stop:410 length:135 start_codon:yes stop_codon:yes gene_type:complete
MFGLREKDKMTYKTDKLNVVPKKFLVARDLPKSRCKLKNKFNYE